MVRIRDHPFLLGVLITGSLIVGIVLIGSLPLPTERPSCSCPAAIYFSTQQTEDSVEGSTYFYNFTIQIADSTVTLSTLSFQLLNTSAFGNVDGCFGQFCWRDGSKVTLAGTQVLLFDDSGCKIASYDLLGDKPLLSSSTSCPAPSLQSRVVVGDTLSLTSPVDISEERYALATPWGFTTIF